MNDLAADERFAPGFRSARGSLRLDVPLSEDGTAGFCISTRASRPVCQEDMERSVRSRAGFARPCSRAVTNDLPSFGRPGSQSGPAPSRPVSPPCAVVPFRPEEAAPARRASLPSSELRPRCAMRSSSSRGSVPPTFLS